MGKVVAAGPSLLLPPVLEESAPAFLVLAVVVRHIINYIKFKIKTNPVLTRLKTFHIEIKSF